jgi:methionyl aminopeptidase
MIVRKTAAELEKMRRAGLLVWRVLKELEAMVQPGVTTMDLEVAAERMILDAGARPAFKGYYVPAVGRQYPYVLCTSVNEEIVHGMPSAKRVLKEGDIVSIDTGVELEGYYGDSAITVPVGQISPEAERLLRVTREALELAIEKVRQGNRLLDISATIERHVTAAGFSVVRDYVGHGIGTRLHEEPQVPNYVDRRNENPRLKEGMVLAIEPMVAAGRAEVALRPDRWTAVTRDGSYAAHFEHCVAVTANGPWVLTRPEEAPHVR